MMKNVTEMGIGTWIFALTLLIGIIIYYKKKNNRIILDSFPNIKKDKLLMADLTIFFKENYEKVSIYNKSSIPVAIRLLKSPTMNIGFDQEKYDGKQLIVATFFDKESNKISEEHSMLFITKELDNTVKDAFGDKEMIVLS